MPARTQTADERLASEPPRSATRAGVAWTLLLAVAVVVVANLWARAAANPPWLSNDRRIVGTKFELAETSRADVVVLGDSSAAFGVNAGVLGEALGTSAVNLATFGRFEVAGDAWTLDEHLAHRAGAAPPKIVVVVHGARTWWLEADGLVLAQLPLPFGYWRDRMPKRSLSPVEIALFALDRYVPLYVQHLGYERGLTYRVRREGDGWSLTRGDFAIPDRPEIAADGSMAIPAEVARWANPESFLERTVLPELDALPDGPFTVPEHQRRAAEALAARADAEGFDVVFVAAPEWERVAEVPKHVAVHAGVEAFLRELCARHDRVHLVEGGPKRVPQSSVENPYHLTAEAAEVWSRELAEAIAGLGLPE